MLEFAWIWVGLIFPLPFLIRLFSKDTRTAKTNGLKVPFLEDFSANIDQTKNTTQSRYLILPIIAWILLIIATMRPQWLGEPIELGVSGRDLILAVDLSGSMQETDFIINGNRVNRLTAIKHVAKEFISRRTGDRLGLILFGSRAYLQTPLTFDRKTVATLLNESVVGLAGEQTAIGDAIGLAVKRLKSQQAKSKVLILLTDGANTAGEIQPLKASELAAKFNLKIYTIGVGADEMIVQNIFGKQRINPSRDLDEATLTKIANLTSGKYFRARDTTQLQQIYQILDKIEPIKKDIQFFNPITELFYYPLALSLCLSWLAGWLRQKYYV